VGRTNASKIRGFSTVAVLLIVLVVLGLGVGGWYVWHENKNDNSTGTKSNSNQQEDTQTAGQGTKPSDPSDGGKYLVIKEWGVRLLLPSGLQNDAYYEYAKDAPRGESIYLRSKTLDTITSTCNGAKFYMYAGLVRSTDKQSDSQDTQGERNFVELNGYWYSTFDTGNETSKTLQCQDPAKVSQEKDDFRLKVGGAQTVIDSLESVELIK